MNQIKNYEQQLKHLEQQIPLSQLNLAQVQYLKEVPVELVPAV